ncbi:hypothetical protein [Nitratiruptor tergarcus]|uniref:Uncharacterized protein n=1 Tax=Nitratiruptor tergarcus DSM 16512 TaxID=1069081 RepID=A0A1W1WRG9_9BACT|nr:hypothetical protein [Nitratiruptor tergarcus]SMC08819.1 hypothetical protein SAMN05660197_0593 [Nitratiruptor tergarcus DSM 16512]
MKKLAFLFSIILFLAFEGCSQKSFTEFKTNIKNIFTSKKAKKNPYLINFKKYFPKTVYLGRPIPKESVIDLNTPIVPKECKPVGWISVLFPKGLNVKSIIFKEIYETKKREMTALKKKAASHGIRYINSYFDTSHSRFVKVYDPYLKKTLNAQITPFKHIIIDNGKLYRESVRAYRCKKTIK